MFSAGPISSLPVSALPTVVVVTPPVTPPIVIPPGAGHGHRHRWDRKRSYLEIDGVLHEIRTRAEAIALLRQVRAKVKKDLPPVPSKREAVADEREIVMPALPDVKLLGDNALTDELQPRLERFAMEMQAIYTRSEAMQRAFAEQDDEEVLMLLGVLH